MSPFPFLSLVLVAAPAQADAGLVAHWSFDEGSGDTIADLSGHGNHGTVHGASFVRRGDGHALSFDGMDDYVDCGVDPSLDLTAGVTLEAWVKPGALPASEPMILGKYYDSFALTQYRDGNAWFYISGGGNNVSARLEPGQWNHVAATFDGATVPTAKPTALALTINGAKVAERASKAWRIASGGPFLMGRLVADPSAKDPAYGATAHWRGELDDVRVYDAPLADDAILARYKQEAAAYGVDTTWFDRIRVVGYASATEDGLVALLDFSGILPRPREARLDVALAAADGSEPLQQQEFRELGASGRMSTSFPLTGLAPGEYTVRARLTAADGLQVSGETSFRYPLPVRGVPDPAVERVGDLPEPARPASYSVRVARGGGLVLSTGGREVPIESSFSYPNGGANRLTTESAAPGQEPGWEVSVRRLGGRRYGITATGRFYTVHRQVDLEPTRLSIKDTIRNTGGEDLGVIIDHHLVAPTPWTASRVAGYPEGAERREAQCPSAFVAWEDMGLGLLPLDDVTIVHSTVYARDGHAGVRDDRFGLAAGAEYTAEWAVYPVASPDYYDFVNFVRHDEGRGGTVEGGFGFLDRGGVSTEHVRLRNLLYGSFGCLTKVADDPEIEIEGIDFLWLPKERARIRAEFEDIRRENPNLKLMFHIAHSLISTNRPDTLFPDSRVLDANGNQVIYPYDYDACAYFSPQRHKEGWRWFIYYPTPGNSFHDALMRSVDVMVDDIGCNGAFMDGFLYGYGSPYTYDRWDGHTVEIDPETKTIRRKLGSVLLLSQPSMVEFVERMHARGAVVVANNVVMTRTIGRLPMITDQECRTGPDVDLAQTPCALGNPTVIRSEADVYRDVLDKLSWGNLYFYYGEGSLATPSLPQRMFPITVETVHAGVIRGRERIVTMRSGVYGWAGVPSAGTELHRAFRYNPIGISVAAEFVTTVDPAGVRTRVDLAAEESAVLERIPAVLHTAQSVNVICERYDASGLALRLSAVGNGRGRAELEIRSGELVVTPGARYATSVDVAPFVAGEDGVLRIPLRLSGPAVGLEVTVSPLPPGARPPMGPRGGFRTGS